MRSTTATAFLSLFALTVSAPAPAFDRTQGTSAVPLPQAAFAAGAKIQDRIPPGNPVAAALPGLQLAPKARSAAPANPYGWNATLDARIAYHAAANGVPLALARRVVRRESNGNPRAVSKGNYGLMQIRLGTARAMGYGGNAQGLLDAETNMTYAMKYLSGALRAAKGNPDRAVALYARGYYYEAKAMGFSPYESPRAASAGLVPITAAR